ncbi:MAG: hypothetical protein V1822_01070 [Candidatus Micrarchaeota archaeon]
MQLIYMRAQITLEALLVAAVGLSLLLIAALAINKLSTAQEGAQIALGLQNDAQQLANSADEICSLGEGNARVIPLSRKGEAVSSGNKNITVFYGGQASSRPALCKVDVRAAAPFGKSAFLWYENSQVVISSEPHS